MKAKNPDFFKDFEELGDSDSRYDAYVGYDRDTGETRKLVFKDFHDSMCEISLSESVPKGIRMDFDVVRHLYVYSWYIYRFGIVSESQAYVTLESALKIKVKNCLNKKVQGLGNLLNLAVKEGWINDDEIESSRKFNKRHLENIKRMIETNKQIEGFYNVSEEDLVLDNQKHCKIIADVFPTLRNHLAHESGMFYEPFRSRRRIGDIADIINQLFEGSRD